MAKKPKPNKNTRPSGNITINIVNANGEKISPTAEGAKNG